MQINIEQAKKIIQEADAILITAGSGMGVDSGLPDFRGTAGFWKAYPVIKNLGYSFSEMANPAWFHKDPELAWAFYGHRLNLYRETTPHDGFYMLLDLVKEKNEDYFIYTSNVDGQFQKAGFDEEKILEIHGTIHHFQCTCSKHGIWSAKDEKVEVDMQKFKALNIPKCIECGGTARPNIMMFGDWDWLAKRSDKQEALYNRWIKNIANKKLAIIEIGAGVAIPSVRMKGERISKQHPNATLIRINPRDFEVYLEKDISIPLGGLEGIKQILN